MPINWRNVNDPNFNSANNLLNDSVKNVQSNIDRLSKLSGKIDQRTVQGQRDDLAGRITNAGLNGTVDRTGLDRLSDNDFNKAVQSGKTQLQNQATQDYNYSQVVQKQTDQPFLDQFNVDRAGVTQDTDISVMADKIRNSDASATAKATALMKLESRDNTVEQAFDAKTDRDIKLATRARKDSADKLASSIVTDSKLGLDEASEERVAGTLANASNIYSDQFGTEITASRDASGQLQITGLENLSPSDAEYVASNINQDLAGLDLNTSRDLDALQQSARDSDLYKSLKTTAEKKSFLSDVAANSDDSFGLQGQEKRDHIRDVGQLKTQQGVDRKMITAPLESLEAVFRDPMPLNDPDKRLLALDEVSKMVGQMSDEYGDTWRWGDTAHAGNRLIKEIANLTSGDSFTVKGKDGEDIKVDMKDLSGQMVITALNVLHESDNWLDNEGVVWEEYKLMLADFSKNKEKFKAENSGRLETLRSQLSDFDLQKDNNLYQASSAASDKIKQRRQNNINAEADIRNLLQYTQQR